MITVGNTEIDAILKDLQERIASGIEDGAVKSGRIATLTQKVADLQAQVDKFNTPAPAPQPAPAQPAPAAA
jgi:hypothetical protein